MNPVDFRDATFHGLRGSLEGMRLAAYDAWVKFGPGTTRQIAEQCGIDLLTFRPRTTDLCQVGLVKVAGAKDGEGIYEAAPQSDWERWREDKVNAQMQLI